MSDILIKTERLWIEELFTPYVEMIGRDYPGYRNHVYRTVTYAMHFLEQDPTCERIVETAFVYHDIGLWSDHELAYLEPSEALAISDNEKNSWGFDPDLLRSMIHWHHKIFPYRGSNERIVEACRKADWIDATKGIIRQGMSQDIITSVEEAFPNLGFHNTLLRLTKDYGGSTLFGAVKVTKGIVRF